MFGVTGATGQLGQLVLEHLAKKMDPSQIVTFARNPEKAARLKKKGFNVRYANYDEPASWQTGLQGVRRLLLISSSEIGKRFEQHQTVIQAAKKNGVAHLFYTSLLNAPTSSLELAEEHLATEAAIEKSGLAYTFLRNGWYLENHTGNIAPALQYSAIYGAAADGRFASAARVDYAQAAVAAMMATAPKKVYELAGDVAFTMTQFAQELGRQSGKKIEYHNESSQAYEARLEQVGLPKAFATLLADSDLGASKNGLYSASRDLHTLIGHAPTSLADAIAAALKQIQSASAQH